MLKKIFSIALVKHLDGLSIKIILRMFGKVIVVWDWDVISGTIN